MSDWEKEQAVKEMRSRLFYIDLDRKRAQALDSLGELLRCETPGTVEQVVVRGRRWWQRPRDSQQRPEREIILTDDERREFRDWCTERAAMLRKRADQTELEIANPKEKTGV